jgi:predicted TIM-barrel fold metal-dependent hydrolase
MIIDTHLHIIDQAALRYPWLASAPSLNRTYSYEEYAREAKRCGITATMHMEVDVDPADIDAEIDYVIAKSKEPGSLLVAKFAACRPEEDGFEAQIERVRSNPFIKGFRRILHTITPSDLSESPKFRENIKRLSGTGLTFDLCIFPHQHKQAIALLDYAPDVLFVLDHCGLPDIKGGQMQPWADTMAEIAKRPNVIGKISGILPYTDTETWTVETIRPWVEHTIGVFGWDRVVWASDWPVCTQGGSLSTWVAATQALISGASEDERTKLFSANAKRIWGL